MNWGVILDLVLLFYYYSKYVRLILIIVCLTSFLSLKNDFTYFSEAYSLPKSGRVPDKIVIIFDVFQYRLIGIHFSTFIILRVIFETILEWIFYFSKNTSWHRGIGLPQVVISSSGPRSNPTLFAEKYKSFLKNSDDGSNTYPKTAIWAVKDHWSYYGLMASWTTLFLDSFLVYTIWWLSKFCSAIIGFEK